MEIVRCTFTGVDEKVLLSEIEYFSEKYPFSEWAFLYSPTKTDHLGKYPSIETIKYSLSKLTSNVNVAVHMCGKSVGNLLTLNSTEIDILNRLNERKGRVQLNLNDKAYRVNRRSLYDVFDLYNELSFIIQYNQNNLELIEDIREKGYNNCFFLFDSSGGNGITPNVWPRSFNNRCGYAGGLGPDNLDYYLQDIERYAKNQIVWIDMETGVRETINFISWMSIQKCVKCLKIVERFKNEQNSETKEGQNLS
jgi:hypothetical protein